MAGPSRSCSGTTKTACRDHLSPGVQGACPSTAQHSAAQHSKTKHSKSKLNKSKHRNQRTATHCEVNQASPRIQVLGHDQVRMVLYSSSLKHCTHQAIIGFASSVLSGGNQSDTVNMSPFFLSHTRPTRDGEPTKYRTTAPTDHPTLRTRRDNLPDPSVQFPS